MTRNNKGSSPIIVALMTMLALSVATLFIVLTALVMGGTTRRERESYMDNGIIGQIATEKVSVKINMENCMMLVGTKTQVTASLYPSGSSSGISWTSSNSDVFTVDSNGNLEVIGTGIVALTANFGDSYDSIAIECVNSEAEAALNLPDYRLFNSEIKPTEGKTHAEVTSSATETTEATSSGKAETSATTAKETESVKPTVQPTTAPIPTKPQPTTAPTPTKPTKPAPEEPTSYTIPTTAPYGGIKVLSTEIAERLESYGFKKYLDNTYVYESGKDYLGEIIITANMTHIYVKGRSTEFDAAINKVLTELLPDSHESVWNMYTGASTDQTIRADGRMVRVVMSSENGHSQIVVYN